MLQWKLQYYNYENVLSMHVVVVRYGVIIIFTMLCFMMMRNYFINCVRMFHLFHLIRNVYYHFLPKTKKYCSPFTQIFPNISYIIILIYISHNISYICLFYIVNTYDSIDWCNRARLIRNKMLYCKKHKYQYISIIHTFQYLANFFGRVKIK